MEQAIYEARKTHSIRRRGLVLLPTLGGAGGVVLVAKPGEQLPDLLANHAGRRLASDQRPIPRCGLQKTWRPALTGWRPAAAGQAQPDIRPTLPPVSN